MTDARVIPGLPGVDAAVYERDCVRVEPLALEEEFVRLPADLAYWNAQYSEAFRRYQLAKLYVEKLSAQLSLLVREDLQSQTRGRVTIAEVEMSVQVSPEYQAARAAEVEAEAEKVRLYGVVDAIRSKKEMLISLGAHMRAEMGADPSIRHRAAVEREVDLARVPR